MNSLPKFNRFAFNEYVKCTKLNKSAFIQHVICANCQGTFCPTKGYKLNSHSEGSDMTVFNYKPNKPDLKYSLVNKSNYPHDNKEIAICIDKIDDYSRFNSWILAIILNSDANIVIKLKEANLRELMEKIINLKQIQYSNHDNIRLRNITLIINANSTDHIALLLLSLNKLDGTYKGYKWVMVFDTPSQIDVSIDMSINE